MDDLVNQMHEVWISCPRCSVSFKESIIRNEDYFETNLCVRCKLLCERCEDRPSSVNNLCQNCQIIMDNKSNNVHDEVNNSLEIISIDVIDEAEENPYKICQLIDKYSNKHPVDSVDAPINGTIGNKSVELILEGLSEYIEESSVILDLGSGSGKTAIKFAAVLHRTVLGIECDNLRHQCSMVDLSTVMQHIDINVTFIHGNIESYFTSFDGYGVIYMFDTAFPPKTISKIKELFNKSTSVKVIVCNSMLDKMGFNVTLAKSLGSLTAGNTNRNFYIYRSNIFSESFVLDEVNDNDIQLARSASRCLELANKSSTLFLAKSRNDLSLEQLSSKELYTLLQRSPVTINGSKFIKVDQVVGVTDKQSCYTVFNRQDLSLVNKYEYRAVVWNGKYLGIITPSYDGNGEILISIIHYTKGPTYDAIIYNIRSASFRKVTVRSLFMDLCFNYKLSLPNEINMSEIMTKYRKEYPIDNMSIESLDSNSVVSRKRKPNEIFSPTETVPKRRTTSMQTSTKSEKKSTELQDKLQDLEEQNKVLKRKALELEKEVNKKNRSTDTKKDNRVEEIIYIQDKDKDKEIKRIMLKNEKDIQDIRQQQDHDTREFERQMIRDLKEKDRRRDHEERERYREDLAREREAKKEKEIMIDKLRQSQDNLFNKLIEMQEDKYQDIRTDSKKYEDRLEGIIDKLISRG